MGHLGNPIAFRLNFEKKWKFNFYVRNIYYPENINNMINIRDYLYYYFTRKKMLYSGVCFSHLYLFKFFKNFYVDVYIYHVDLERTSYELINFLYREYYNSYNNIKYAENKTELQLKNFFILREFSNSDLVVFYITFLLFNQKKHVIQKETYLNRNKVFLKTKLYTKFIVYYYIKYLLNYYKKKSILHQNYKWKLQQKQYWLKKRKKMQMWNKITLKIRKYFNLRWISKKLRKKYSKFIPKEEYTQKWFIRKQYWFNKWLKYKINNKINKVFFHLFYKKNKFQFLKKMKRFKIRRWSFKSRKSLYDDTFKNQLEDYTANYDKGNFGKLRKFNFTTLLLYLAKKVKFNKYRNSKTLWKKWSVIYKHYKLLYVAKSLKLKYIANLKSFFFLLHLFIYLSKKGSTIKNKGNFFNFRNAIYSNIYFGLFQTLFYDAFDIVTTNLKLLLCVLDTNLKKDNIVFNYFFISNDTVSSQLIARYVCLKFKRGFTVRRVIGPLKRELVRVAKKGWGTQKPYIIYHYKAMYKNKKNYVKRAVRSAVKMCRYFFYFNVFKNYKKNNIFIYFNLFKFFRERGKNKYRFSFYLYYKYTIILYAIFRKLFFLREFYKKYKAEYKIRKRNNWLINIANLFPVIFNLDKKFNFNYSVKKGETINDTYIEASYLNSFRFFNILLFYKRIKKVNNKAVAISSYLNNNLFNFGIINSLWSIYINFNKRNTRNKYIPIFNSPIMGLKMVIKGRFSRRDRVSKMMINMGKVPLNTLRAVIDYDFLSVPIKNSAMSFKIYIYRKKLWAIYKNNVIF